MGKSYDVNYLITMYKQKGYSKKELLNVFECMYKKGDFDLVTFHIIRSKVEIIYNINE